MALLIADRLEIVATDDPAPSSPDDDEVNPGGEQTVPLATAPAPGYERPFEQAFLGWMDGNALWPLGLITRLCSVVDGHPQTANVPDGHFRLPRIDRFEVLKRLRAQNANQAKSLLFLTRSSPVVADLRSIGVRCVCGARSHQRLPDRAGEYDGAMRLTAAITKDGDWFVAQCLEVDVASQCRSVEEARANLAEALALYFEDQDVEIGDAPIDVAV